jgi:hypothetical protein
MAASRPAKTKKSHHAHQHLQATLQEQRAPADPVDGEDRDEGRQEVDQAGDHRGHERRAAAESRGLELKNNLSLKFLVRFILSLKNKS